MNVVKIFTESKMRTFWFIGFLSVSSLSFEKSFSRDKQEDLKTGRNTELAQGALESGTTMNQVGTVDTFLRQNGRSVKKRSQFESEFSRYFNTSILG